MTKPFGQIAPYYDRLMQEVDYGEWVDYVVSLLDRAGTPRGVRLLEAACGTGTAALLFHQAGYQVSGFDRSSRMLAEARRKAKGTGIKFRQADLANFTVRQSQQAVTCLFDSLNYLTAESELAGAFRSAYRALSPQGAFVFDLNTIHALSRYWDNRLEVKEAGGIVSIWRNSYDWVNRRSNLNLTVFAPRGRAYRRIDEFHQESALPLDRVESMLKGAGFDRMEIFRHLTLEPPREDAIRVTIIARRD